MPTVAATLLRHALVLAAVAAAAGGESLTIKPGCQPSCGGVGIPYPFGIGADCFLEGFEVACTRNNGTGTGGRGYGYTPELIIGEYSFPILNLSVAPAKSLVMVPVTWQCFNLTIRSGDASNRSTPYTYISPSSPYRISSTHNMLVVVGCNTVGALGGRSTSFERSGTGCWSFCRGYGEVQDGVCAGSGCCHVDLPGDLAASQLYFKDSDHGAIFEFNPCDYTFIVDRNNYTFRRADLNMDLSTSQPVWLDWAIRDGSNNSNSMSCANAAKRPDYACKSMHSACVDSSTVDGSGYNCNCTKGYEGNPYVTNGCTNINECEQPEKFPCHGECTDTDGSYDCKCRRGYESKGDPKEESCSPKFPLAAKLALGITFGISLLIVALLSTLIMLQKRRLHKLFTKNGGVILQNEGLTIFTKDELKKITRNNAYFLGKGNFGNVYKGFLSDGTVVAVKASIEVNKDRKMEFTAEVKIQMKMIHRNILRLVGCCLELDVPMLVYEYAQKGSLQDVLHGKTGHQHDPLPLDLRLDIAIGSAEGLKYMHSYAAQTVRHGDVKPDNILLDENSNPKISDFGLSKLLKVDDYYTTIVVGCKAYIDPIFIKTGLLTQKSDVYSFGAVLLELITRKPIVYDGNCSLLIEFPRVYAKENSGRSMFDKDIAIEDNISILEEIGKLAIECLKEDLVERPDMTEVAERLMMLRRAKRHERLSNRASY